MKVANFLRKLLIIFLLILLFLCILITMLFFSTKNLIKSDNIANYIKDADILNMKANIIYNVDDDITLKDKIVSMALANNIPSLIVDDIMESDEINDFLGEYFNKMLKYLINDDNKPILSNEMIDKMSSLANESLEDHINIMLDEETLNEYILNYCNELMNTVPDNKEIINKLPIDLFQILVNFNLIYLYVIILLLIGLITILSKYKHNIIKYLGLILLVLGLVFVILGSCDNLIY